jgi:hypothetical protein
VVIVFCRETLYASMSICEWLHTRRIAGGDCDYWHPGFVIVAGEMGGEVQESLIASRFNSESKLSAVVTETGPNEITFAVESK